MTTPEGNMERQDWLRRLNYLGSAVGGAEELVNLDAEEMLASARASTGLEDFGDDEWREAYDVLTESLAKDVALTTIGRLMTRGDIIRALRNRLLVVEELKKSPAILQERIETPLLVAGQGRSGTTILFELLAQDTNNRAPLGWEAASPVAPPGNTLGDGISQHEIGQCDNELWDDVQPEMLVAHEHRWDLPVECIHFLAPDFSSDYWVALYNASGFMKWKFSHNSESAYDWHKKILQLLQTREDPRHEGESRRWLLKSAAHTRSLDVLLKVYPDLRIIQTHRDPVKTVPSTIRLTGYLRWVRASDVDMHQLTQMVHFGYQASLKKVMQERMEGVVPGDQIADIHFKDLMADPVATIRRAYRGLGLEFSTEFEDRIRAYLALKPRHKFGQHQYAAEDYGLTDEKIRNDFKFYTEHYGIALEV